MIQGICGRTYIASSVPDGPLSSWESRLRERLAMVGSTEFAVIWREKTTPAGQSISRLSRSTRLSNGTASIGSLWPVPTVADVTGGRRARSGSRSGEMLLNGVMLATWRAPLASDDKYRLQGDSQQSKSLSAQVIATWVAPQAMDGSKGSLGPRPHDTGISLPQHMAATAPSGQTQNGSFATTAKRGAPNPQHPAWLMGFSGEWLLSAMRALAAKPRRS